MQLFKGVNVFCFGRDSTNLSAISSFRQDYWVIMFDRSGLGRSHGFGAAVETIRD